MPHKWYLFGGPIWYLLAVKQLPLESPDLFTSVARTHSFKAEAQIKTDSNGRWLFASTKCVRWPASRLFTETTQALSCRWVFSFETETIERTLNEAFPSNMENQLKWPCVKINCHNPDQLHVRFTPSSAELIWEKSFVEQFFKFCVQ